MVEMLKRNREAKSPDSFIGRNHERAELLALVRAARLITVVGPGGSGKTRLVSELSGGFAEDRADGVSLVDLTTVLMADALPAAIARVIGIRDEDTPALESAIDAFFRDKAALLILDNCEHIAEACARQCARLLAVAPHLVILATSREPLRLDGEVTWRLGPLSVPSSTATVAEALRSDAVTLLRARARRPVRTGVEVQAAGRICRSLDGLPLAIELAASLVPALGLERLADQIDEQVRTLPAGTAPAGARHASMSVALDWSYGLLSSDEETLFSRLAAFAGGWSVAAAEEVCGVKPLSREAIRAHLRSLADRSLITTADGSDRYRFLEPIRQYAVEKLKESGEEKAIRDRHLDWVEQLARIWGPAVTSERFGEALMALDADESNILAAMDWSREREHDANELVKICGSLGTFWAVRNRVSTTAASIAHAIGATAGERSTRRCEVLIGAGQVIILNDWISPAGLPLFEEARELAEESGDTQELIRAIHGIAFSLHRVGRGEEEFGLFQEALSLATRSGDAYWQCVLMVHLSLLLAIVGNLDAAQEMGENALRLGRERGYALVEPMALNALNEVCRGGGEWDKGAALARQEVDAVRTSGASWLEPAALYRLANLERRAGNTEAAVTAIDQAIAVERHTGRFAYPPLTLAAIAAVCPLPAFAREGTRLLAASNCSQPYLEFANTSENTYDKERFQAALPAELFDKEWQAGRDMDTAAALALGQETLTRVAAFVRRVPDVPSALSRLSPREAEVLRLVAAGGTNQEISESLGISLGTTQRHIANIFGKIGVTNRTQATAFAFFSGKG